MNDPSAYDDEIKRLYLDERLAMNKIAKELGIAVGKVYNRIKIMDVPSRTISDYPPTDKQRKCGREAGMKQKGKTRSTETRERISESKFAGGIGHKKKRTDGYIAVYFPDHPKSTSEGYVMEHILVAEAVNGRHLREDECVHHKNFKRDDNRACNLQVMTKSEHMSYHMILRHRKGA